MSLPAIHIDRDHRPATDALPTGYISFTRAVCELYRPLAELQALRARYGGHRLLEALWLDTWGGSLN
jgi:hypothetical protein